MASQDRAASVVGRQEAAKLDHSGNPQAHLHWGRNDFLRGRYNGVARTAAFEVAQGDMIPTLLLQGHRLMKALGKLAGPCTASNDKLLGGIPTGRCVQGGLAIFHGDVLYIRTQELAAIAFEFLEKNLSQALRVQCEPAILQYGGKLIPLSELVN